MSLTYAKSYGKPPPESTGRIEDAGGFNGVSNRDERRMKTLLIADGAPCYKALARRHGLMLRQ